MSTEFDKISLPIETPAVNLSGLEQVIAKLQLVERHVVAVNAALNGLNSLPLRGVEGLTDLFKQLQASKGALSLPNLAQQMGMDDRGLADLRAKFAAMKGQVKDFVQYTETFKSPLAAARALAPFEAQTRQQARLTLKELLTPTMGQMAGVASGSVPLTIPGAQVQAVLQGTVQLIVPATQVQGVVPGGMSVPGGGASGSAGKSGSKSLAAGPGGALTGSTIVETAKKTQLITEALADDGRVILETFAGLDRAAGAVQRKIKDPALRNQLKAFRDDLKSSERLRAAQAPAGSAPEMRAAALQAAAVRVSAAWAKAKKNLPPFLVGQEPGSVKGSGSGLAREMHETLGKIAAQQTALENQANARRVEARRRDIRTHEAQQRKQFEEHRRQVRSGFGADLSAMQERQRRAEGILQRSGLSPRERSLAGAELAEIRARELERLAQNRLLTERQQRTAATRAAAAREEAASRRFEAANPPKGGAHDRWLNRGMRGFTPEGFAKNLATVSGWMLAVNTLFKGVELVTHSFERMVQIGAQTARLSQVFKGVGGSAQELTDDVLRLAAAHGRSTEEAMDSAIQWSRLGMTRKEVNEAVTASLMAANVAEISAADATKQLSALTAVYHLRAGDLVKVLGMLNQTSNTYNVTNADLLEGLSRSAVVAKQFGLSLAETQGIIGAAVGTTGQSGAMMGNALKTVLARLGSPDRQEILRNRYGLDVEGMSGPDALQSLWLTYNKLNEAEQRNLAIKIAGATQYNRFLAIMDSYVQGQKLAIASQENLNSAELENAKILGTVRAQREGVKSAWDRLVVQQTNTPQGMLGNGSFNNRVATGLEFVKNVTNGLSKSGVSLMRSGLSMPGISEGQQLFMRSMNRLLDPTGAKRRTATQSAFDFESLGGSASKKALLIKGQSERLQALQSEEDRMKALGTISEYLTESERKRVAAAIQVNDLLSARSVLGEAEARYNADSTAHLQKARDLNDELLRSYQAELKTVEQRMETERGSGRTALLQRALDLQKQIDQVTGRRRDYEAAEQADLENRAGVRQGVLGQLETQKRLLADIARLQQQMPGFGAESELAAQERTVTQQVRLLEAARESLQDRPGFDEGSSGRQQLDEQLRQLRAELEALRNPAVRAAARLQDDRGIALGRAKAEADAAGFGETEGERLTRRQMFLAGELSKFNGRDVRDLSENEKLRALEFQVELMRTQEAIQKRIIAMRGEEKQILEEANREFQRSLLFASPGTMLRKLTVASLAGRVNSPGAFFALSPENRQEFDALNGGDPMRRFRREQGALNGWGGTVEGQQAWQNGARGGENQLRGALSQTAAALLERAGSAAAVALSGFNRAMTLSTATVANFTTALQNAVTTLQGLASPKAAGVPAFIPPVLGPLGMNF